MKFLPFLRSTGLIAVLCTGLAAFVVPCFGDTMMIGSSAADTSNDSGSATVEIPPNPVWSAPLPGSSWVSYTQSGNPGSGFVSPPNGTEYTFSQTFTINGTPNSGHLSVMADDTASVMLNGVLLMAMAPATANTYFICSDYTIGCLAGTTGSMDISSYLQSGSNVLSIMVKQANSVSYGVDYAANIDFTPSITSVPEPGTLALFGAPLVALALLKRRRK